MKVFILTTLTALALAGAATAQVQPQQAQIAKPVISPYLNLLRNNNPAYLNYYGLVQPQIQTQNALNNLQTQVSTLQNAPQQAFAGTGSELATGKTVGYFTHRQYFMNGSGYQQQRSVAGGQGGNFNNALYQPSLGADSSRNNAGSNPSVMPFRR